MVISEQLNQYKLKEILMYIYMKDMETENIHVTELIEEIIKQILDDTISVGAKNEADI